MLADRVMWENKTRFKTEGVNETGVNGCCNMS